MKRWICIVLLLIITAVPVSATTIEAPTAPSQVQNLMPDPSMSFGQGVWYIFVNALQQIRPEIRECCKVCFGIICTVLMLSFLRGLEGKSKMAADFAGVIAISCLLLGSAGSMIGLASDTIEQITEYGRLLLPVMTAALASQGGTATSAAIYMGTAVFDAVLSTVISSVLIPIIYIYLAFGVVNAATDEQMLKKIMQFMKGLMTWLLKTVLYVFTGYIGITGVVSGTADKTALKAAKLTISGVVPVVGNILSDASETILVSAGVVKNAAGVYGMLAVGAIAIGPFLKIGVQYVLLKVTAGLCGMIGDGKDTELIECFSGAMGMLLAMTGAACVIQFVSTVCFMKGMQ